MAQMLGCQVLWVKLARHSCSRPVSRRRVPHQVSTISWPAFGNVLSGPPTTSPLVHFQEYDQLVAVLQQGQEGQVGCLLCPDKVGVLRSLGGLTAHVCAYCFPFSLGHVQSWPCGCHQNQNVCWVGSLPTLAFFFISLVLVCLLQKAVNTQVKGSPRQLIVILTHG